MKIVQVTPSLNLGGGEKFTVDLCNELTKIPTNEVYLIVLQKIDNDNILYRIINENVHLLEVNKTSAFSIKSVATVFKLLHSIKPDIVHTHLRGLIYSSVGIVFLKIPTLHTIHTLAEKEIGKTVRKVYRVLFNYFKVHPVSISNEVLKSVKKVYGDNKNILVLNGVSKPTLTDEQEDVKQKIESYKHDNKTKVLVNIASINDNKNQLMLIDIFNEFKEDNENIILLLVGSASGVHLPYLEKCKERAKDNMNIYFMGAVPNVGDYLASADAICLSSKYEGLPLVVLEAMSLGVPTLATPAGGIPNVIENGVNGYVAEDFERDSLKKIIVSFLNSDMPFNQTNMVKTYNQKYSISKTAQEYIKQYDKIVHRTK